MALSLKNNIWRWSCPMDTIYSWWIESHTTRVFANEAWSMGYISELIWTNFCLTKICNDLEMGYYALSLGTTSPGWEETQLLELGWGGVVLSLGTASSCHRAFPPNAMGEWKNGQSLPPTETDNALLALQW
jgi:hypothetical protein